MQELLKNEPEFEARYPQAFEVLFPKKGIKTLLKEIKDLFPRLSHLWLDAGYRGEKKGKGWVEKVLAGR